MACRMICLLCERGIHHVDTSHSEARDLKQAGCTHNGRTMTMSIHGYLDTLILERYQDTAHAWAQDDLRPFSSLSQFFLSEMMY